MSLAQAQSRRDLPDGKPGVRAVFPDVVHCLLHVPALRTRAEFRQLHIRTLFLPRNFLLQRQNRILEVSVMKRL